ncbi:vWA domain-containing protein [Fodinicola acaciae]|uniref:vWA domain-containing protein n=1 Tax=Fodinicola acaciae TaxID=2681555 RepID=UPI0013D48CBA|nr:VWA domain-containing protein [Fodinicola acaciae]
MTGQFQLEVFQNEYLPEGAAEVNAIITVTATGSGAAKPAGPAAEVIIMDCSGSMEMPRTKLDEAKRATRAAIDALRDGVQFAVVNGMDIAEMIYPKRTRLVAANASTRAEAKRAVTAVRADGGTAIGEWLRLADQLFIGHSGSVKHAILLTDGRNEHETPEKLDRILKEVSGNFVCDCRGVGTDWEVGELRKVATRMLGSLDIVAEPAGLAADFRAMTAAAMGKDVADVRLRLWTPQGATIKYVKQVEPSLVDLTGRRVESAARSGDYPLASWGDESRDYHLCIEVKPAAVGDRMLAGRVSLLDGDDTVLGKAQVLAVWTDDTALSTRINPQVAHYTGQAELAEAIQEGLAARKSGDVETATAKLGRAVALATETGHEDTAKLLAKVVDIDDPVTGTVRLKRQVAKADEMTLDTRSTVTKRVRKPGGS